MFIKFSKNNMSNFRIGNLPPNRLLLIVYKGVYLVEKSDGENRTIIQIVNEKGFKDTIKLLVIIDTGQDIVEEVKVLEHHESEDYGAYLSEEWFLDRFGGKSTDRQLALVKISARSPEEVVAITGATCSSRAVLDTVNICMANYNRIKREVNINGKE